MAFRSPMLASDYKPELLKYPLYASPKIDGIRAVIDRIGNLIDPLARSGKIIPNKHIQSRIGLTPLLGLDGELVVGEEFAPDVYNKTSSGVMAREGKPDFTYWVFDFRFDAEDPDAGSCWLQRFEHLKSVVARLNRDFGTAEHPNIKVLPHVRIEGPEELASYETECIAQGFEGIMIRDPDAKYKFGRSTARGGELLKVKRILHDEFEIIGFEEQMHNANEAFTDELGRTKRSSAKDGLVPDGTLGAFIGRNEDLWPGQTFNVSPGVLTHKERKSLWEVRDRFMGLTGVMKHLPHGAKDKPRHGRFNGFRDKIDL